jgi:sulfoxide reductase heme-binding subunit YedZ
MSLFTLLGWITWWTLFATLTVRPLADITGLKILKYVVAYRKWIGISVYLIACIHITLILTSKALNLSIFWNPQYWNFNTNIAWGMLTILVLTPVFITSNKYSMRLLKRNWKRLHKLVYVAFILAGIHIYVFNRDPFITLVPIITWFILWLWTRNIRQRLAKPKIKQPAAVGGQPSA